MITLNVQTNVAQFVRNFNGNIANKSRQAVADALTRTVRIARIDVQQEVKRSFDRPTPYTVNSVYTRAATAKDLTAVIRFKDSSSGLRGRKHYLYPQVEGGGRDLKGFEYALQSRGLMPTGMYAVPGSAAKLNAYGNMSPGQIRQILSALGAAELTSGYSANRTATSKKRRRNLPNYFIPRRGSRLAPGVWQRFGFAMGSAVKPVLMFVRAPRYTKRLRFVETVQRAVDSHFANELSRSFNERIAKNK